MSHQFGQFGTREAGDAVRKGREQVADGDVHDIDEVLRDINEIVNRKVG